MRSGRPSLRVEPNEFRPARSGFQPSRIALSFELGKLSVRNDPMAVVTVIV